MPQVTATVTRVDVPPEGGEEEMGDPYARFFRVTLRHDGRRMTVPFSQGSAWTTNPTAAEVLECLASDAASADEHFEDWCANYGYDTDSRRAERIYKQVQRQTAKLRRLMGDDYEALVWGPGDVEENVAKFTASPGKPDLSVVE